MARPKTTKAHKIRDHLAKGKTVAEVMKATGATASYVYTVKAKMQDRNKSKGIMALKTKPDTTVTVSGGLTTLTLPTFEFDKEAQRDVPSEAPAVKRTFWQRVKQFFGD